MVPGDTVEVGLLRELARAPNLLSLVRVPLGALVWVAPSNVAWVLALIALAALSDLLDGLVARRMGVPAEGTGAWLDPLCDKVFVVSALCAVWVAFRPPWWMALVAGTREVVVFALVVARLLVPAARARPMPYRALIAGKATTVAQFSLFTAVLLGWRAAWPWLAVLSAGLGLVAGAQYARRALRALHADGG